MRTRVIPYLMLRDGGLYKTVRFRDPQYIGDPINAVRVFNDKEVDEIIVVDAQASVERRGIQYDLIAELAGECFMPMCYGGGVRSVDDFSRIYEIGAEKVAVNTAAVEVPDLVRKAAEQFGSQSVVVSIDVRSDRRGHRRVWIRSGREQTKLDPVDHARRMEGSGAGELLLGSIDRDGTRSGYDLDLIATVTAAVNIPVLAIGGAGSVADLRAAIEHGAAGAVAGSLFVLHGPRRAVLISYLDQSERAQLGYA